VNGGLWRDHPATPRQARAGRLTQADLRHGSFSRLLGRRQRDQGYAIPHFVTRTLPSGYSDKIVC